jgi:hypothetical protein
VSLNELTVRRTVWVAVGITGIAGAIIGLLAANGLLSPGALTVASFWLGWFNFVYFASKLGRRPTSRRYVIVLIAAGVFFTGAVQGLGAIRNGDLYAIIPTVFSLAMGAGFLLTARRLRRPDGSASGNASPV